MFGKEAEKTRKFNNPNPPFSEIISGLLSSFSSIPSGCEAILKYNGQVYINPVMDIPRDWRVKKFSISPSAISKFREAAKKSRNKGETRVSLFTGNLDWINELVSFLLNTFDNIFILIPRKNLSFIIDLNFLLNSNPYVSPDKEPAMFFYIFLKEDSDMEALADLLSHL